MSEMDKKKAYEIVFNDLKQIGLFCGKYDAKNGKESYMHGVSSVMENIALGVSEECYNRFSMEFLKNMIESEEKAGKK